MANIKQCSTMYLQSTAANERFLQRFSPSMKTDVACNRAAAVAEVQGNPTLRDVAMVYGGGVVSDWLQVQLTQAFALCGFDYQLGAERTIAIVAAKVAAEYPYLRLGEIALFLHDFEQGAFGDFCVRFDSQRFFTALRQFLQTRAALRERAAAEARDRERTEWRRRAVPCPPELQNARRFVKN